MTARPQEVAQGPAVRGGGTTLDSRTLFPIVLASRLRRFCISFSLPGSLEPFPLFSGLHLPDSVCLLSLNRLCFFLPRSISLPQGFSVSLSASLSITLLSGFLSVPILNSLSLLSLLSAVSLDPLDLCLIVSPSLGLYLVSLYLALCVSVARLGLLLWVPHPVTSPPGVPHRIVAAFGAAAFSHFFLFLRLLLSSLAARCSARAPPARGSLWGAPGAWRPLEIGPLCRTPGPPPAGSPGPGCPSPWPLRIPVGWAGPGVTEELGGVASGGRRFPPESPESAQRRGPESSKDGTDIPEAGPGASRGGGSWLLGRHAPRGGTEFESGS